MYLQFLTEDQTGETLIRIIMDKIVQPNPSIIYDCKSFKGIGNIPKKGSPKERKNGMLLHDLPQLLRGFNKSLGTKGYQAAIIVVVDNDTRDTDAFLEELKNIASSNNITIDHVFCIAIEEIEAWLLGDRDAVIAAYPDAKKQVLDSYKQDSICGTWELLANAIYKGG